MSNNNYKDLIDQYLTGTISDNDKSVLESKLNTDASLRAEMSSQSEMIEGLKQFRKNQLKARMDSLPVDVGVVSTISQSTAIKTMVTIGVSALLVGGMYYFSEHPFNDAPEFEKLSPVTEFRSLPENNPAKITEPIKIDKVEAPKEATQPVASVESNEPEGTEPSASEEKTEEIKLSINRPKVVEFDEDDEFEAATIEEHNATEMADPAESSKPIDVEVSDNVKDENRLQYQFYEEKLYLYGNFGDIPYEILEINRKGDKMTYLYHEGVYYKLFYPTRKITDLEKVTNQSLIEELKIMREKKAL